MPFLALLLSAAHAACPTDVEVPAGAWPTTDAALPAAELAALEDTLFPPDLDWDDDERRGIRTEGVVIVHHGRLIYERYAHGYDADTPHLAWSATKTFTNTLLGVATLEGRMDINNSVCAYLDDVPEHACAIAVADFLSMGSGLDWKETYEHDPPTSSSVLAMLYGEGRHDMARFVLSHRLRDPPGATWMYSSGDTNVLAAVAGAVLAPAHGDRFPWRVLFDPLGITTAVWERDEAGTYIGSSYLYLSPRDMARLGLLWLRDGCWGPIRMLPEGWVAWSTEVVPGMKQRPIDWEPGGLVQGRQVWLNRPLPEQGSMFLPWPSAPDDTYAALGHWKQSITVIPSLDLVVVRTADDRDGSWSHDAFLARVIALVEAM